MENIIQNEELLKKLAAVETEEELNKVLAENNIVLEEGVTAKQFLEAMNSDAGEELGEDDLDAVAGGVIVTPAIIAGAIAIGVSIAIYIKRYWKKRR